MKAVVTMSLVIIVALVILIVGQKIFVSYGASGALEVCRASVLSQAKISAGGVSPLSLDCQRRYIDISEDHVEFGNEPDNTKTIPVLVNGVKKKNFAKLDSDILNYVLAEEMKTCWYQFGEGQVNVFPNNMPTSGFQPDPDDVVCFICSQINFDKSVANKKFPGLMNYLNDNYIPEKKYTYREYFNGPSLSKFTWDQLTGEGIFDYFEKSPSGDITIDTSKDLSVIFYKEFDTSRLNELGKKLVDLGSKKTDIYYVFVIPTDRVEDVCEIQAS